MPELNPGTPPVGLSFLPETEGVRHLRSLDMDKIDNFAAARMAAQRTIEHYREKGLKTDEDVYALTKCGLLGTKIGTRRNCKFDDHVAPFKFVADVLLQRENKGIVWANRSGSKSYFAGMVTWIQASFLPKLEVTILGGSREQAEKSYKAMNDFWEISQFKEKYLKEEPLLARTTWRWGSSVQVLAASTKSVRGPHPQWLVMDEIDEMEKEVYESALSQPQQKHGIPASLWRLSTNHRLMGIMDNLVMKAQEEGSPKIYKWCIWECLESCRDYRCSTCKLSAWCPGEHMKQADGYYMIEDFLDKLSELSMRSIQLEWFCEKVGAQELVYGGFFDEDRHMPPDCPGIDTGRPAVISLDFGGSNPFSVGWWQKFPKWGWVRVDEIYQAHTTNAKIIEKAKKHPLWKKCQEGVCDPSRNDSRREWRESGIVMRKGNNEVDEGIDAMRNALDPVFGNPKIFFNRKCKDTKREFFSYEEKDGKPVDKHNHAMDDTRYFVRHYVKKGGGPGIRRM